MLIRKHEFVCGCTQSGKTYYSIKRGEEHEGAVFFWNPQDTKNRFTKASGDYYYLDLENLLAQGGKISYEPVFDKKIAEEELRLIVQRLLQACIKGKIKDLLFIADECQIYARNGSSYNPIEDIFTRGLGKGMYGLAITQRPALVSNTLFTQAEIKTYFRLEEEEWDYFRRQSVPIDNIQEQIRAAGEHYFIKKVNGEYSKPQKK